MAALRGSRSAAAAVVLALLTSACHLGLVEQDASGTPAAAVESANDFLSLLTAKKAAEAWDRLTPSTKAVIYNGDQSAFVSDVTNADWSRFNWEIGPVTDYEVSWGVHFRVDGGGAPDFLSTKAITGRPGASDRSEMILLVQLGNRRYEVAGFGL